MLEQLLEREIVYLPCSHHIYEIILKSVFDLKFGATSVSKDRLLEKQPRDDYRELLELTVIFWVGNFQMILALKYQVPSIMLGGWQKLFIA